MPVVNITWERLSELVSEAFDCGYRCCYDLKSDQLDEILKDFCLAEGWRIWSVADIKELPEGTIFQHILKGRCWLVIGRNGEKYAQFEDGQSVRLNSDSHPWDKPMKRISS